MFASGLRKSYGALEAVRGLDMAVEEGEYVGLLGPNGAGKSTTMSMISTVLKRTSGELRVLGQDPDQHGVAIRRRMGICPQDDLLDTELNVRQNLLTYGRYYGLARKDLRAKADALLEWMDLTPKADARVATLSGGFRRRLAIARSLVNDPHLLLLDEPTTGLDPTARRLVWERVRALKRTGMTMVLTTHFMEEAEQLCDRIVLVNSGRVVAEGSPGALVRRYAGHEVVELVADGPAERVSAPYAERGLRCATTADKVHVFTTSGAQSTELLAALGPEERRRALVRRASLEDVYVLLTGEQLSEPPEEE